MTQEQHQDIARCICLQMHDYAKAHDCDQAGALEALARREFQITLFTPQGRFRVVPVAIGKRTADAPFAGLALHLAPIGTQDE